MDATEGWNDLADYSLFLPDDAFYLFGQFDLDVDLPNFLGPEFTEGNAACQDVECTQQEVSALDFENPSPILTQPNELLTSPEPPVPVLENSLAFTGEPFQGRNSEVRSTTDPAEGLEPNEMQETKAKATKRKFLTAFSAMSGEEVQLRTRRPFSEGRRQAVALHRMIGVCLHCRLRKVAAGPTEPISSG